MAIIKEFTNYDGSEVLYPVTVAQAVYIDQNTPITNNLLTTSDKQRIQSAQLEWEIRSFSSTQYLRVKINSTSAWMLSFMVNIYSGYNQHRIQISGYNYASIKTWYSPKAQLLSQTSLQSIQVTFAKDADNDLSVYIPISGDYGAATVSNIVNGNAVVKDPSLFTLSRVSEEQVPTTDTIVVVATSPTASSIGVGFGGTGASAFTSGELLIGNGANPIGTRSIKNMTSKGNLGWTNANTDIYIPTINTLAYWDGRYNSSTSNLAYCVKGAFGTLATKNSLNKSDVGLGNVDNTSDEDKPISTATQTALDTKQATITGGASTITSSDLTENRALIQNSSGKVAVQDVTSTELGYLDGVTSAIQTQLDNKSPKEGSNQLNTVANNISFGDSGFYIATSKVATGKGKPVGWYRLFSIGNFASGTLYTRGGYNTGHPTNVVCAFSTSHTVASLQQLSGRLKTIFNKFRLVRDSSAGVYYLDGYQAEPYSANATMADQRFTIISASSSEIIALNPTEPTDDTTNPIAELSIIDMGNGFGYLPLSGGTLTGILTAKANQYTDSYSGQLNMANSNIYGVNSIYTADASDNAAKGIHFYRDSGHVDTLWMNGGDLLFVPNRALGTSTSKSDSQKVGRFTSNPTTGQVVVTDGTTGGMKTTGYTIATSVPENALFTDTITAVKGDRESTYSTGEVNITPQKIGAVATNGSLLTTNPFAPESLKGPYISKIDNAFYCADKRWNVTATNIGSISRLFDGDYEAQANISSGNTAVITMDFTNEPTGYFPGYPYGYIYISFYYTSIPKSISGRVYCNYNTQGVGWHDLTFSETSDSTNNATTYVGRQGYFNISKLEITIVARDNGNTSVTEMEMKLDRPYSGRTPFLSKYQAETLYYDLTAPKFIGQLNGTAILTGTPTAPTAAAGTNTTQIATTAFVKTAIDNIINGAPEAYDTLLEISNYISQHNSEYEALLAITNDKANTSEAGQKLNLASTTLSLQNKSGTTLNQVTLSKDNVGLGNVDNKSSATIRSEITHDNVTTALGYTPVSEDDIDAIKLGGRNLLKDSHKSVSNGSYATADYYFGDRPPLENEVVTLQIKGQLASSKTAWQPYNSGAGIHIPELKITSANYDSVSGIYTVTGKWRVGSSSNTYLRIYAQLSTQSGTSSIEWVKLERGEKATDWTPAPEDFGQLAYEDSLTPSDIGAQPAITGGATTITSDNLTADKALISNASGKVAVSSVTQTELGYLDGVTSNIQTQLNNKEDSIGYIPVNKAGDTMSGMLSVPCVRTANIVYGVSYVRIQPSIIEAVLYTGIKWIGSRHMPSVYLHGYGYGYQSPIDLMISFYLYGTNPAVYNAGVVNRGSTSPDIYIFKYTSNETDYAAIGIKLSNACENLMLSVDVQDDMGKFGHIDLGSSAWHWSQSADEGIIPEINVDACKLIPYKANILNPSKVNGHTVNSDVPANAVFTDTKDLTQMTGTLPVGNGGTGKTTLNDAANAFINQLSEGTSPANANDYIVAQYANGGTTTTTYHRRKLTNIFKALNYAASDSSGGAANTLKNFTTSSTSSIDIDSTTTGGGIGYVNGLTTSDWNYRRTDGALYRHVYSSNWAHQIYGDYRTGQISVRGLNDGEWQDWHRIIDETNWSTIMTNATQSDNGLLSPADKIRIDKNTFYVVKGTQTANGANWTGAIDLPELFDGLTIVYYLPRASAANATLELTLSDNTTTGKIPIYVTSTTRMGTHYNAGSTVYLTYWSAGQISVNGTATTENRWTSSDYWNSNTLPNEIYYYNTQVAKSDIAANTVIVGDENGYAQVAAGVTFDLTYPILYTTAAIAATKTNYANLRQMCYDKNLSCLKSGFTSASNRAIFLVVTLSGRIATIDEQIAVDSANLPNTENGKYYILLGKMGNQSTGANCFIFNFHHPIYQYVNGAFREYVGDGVDYLPLTGGTLTGDLRVNNGDITLFTQGYLQDDPDTPVDVGVKLETSNAVDLKISGFTGDLVLNPLTINTLSKEITGGYSFDGLAASATNASHANLLKPSNENATYQASVWRGSITDGVVVWGQRFADQVDLLKDDGTGITDSGDITLWLAKSGNAATLNLSIDGNVYVGGSNRLASVSEVVTLSGTQTITGAKTFSNNIEFSNSGTTTRQIGGIVGDNDRWRVAGGATAANAGWMEIATADDGNEPVYVRQYSGNFATVKHTATLLDGSGNTSFPGHIRAIAGHVYAGDASQTGERQIGAESGAGKIYLYAQGSASGNRGLYVPAHGTGGAQSIISIDTNNNISINSGINGTTQAVTDNSRKLATTAFVHSFFKWGTVAPTTTNCPNGCFYFQY